jgi:hypothetical protein
VLSIDDTIQCKEITYFIALFVLVLMIQVLLLLYKFISTEIIRQE